MASRQIRFDERAANDVRAAAEWYDAQRDDLGREFLAELDACVERCAEYPDLHESIAPVALRRALFQRFPFALYYRREEDGDLLIVAVAHTARDPAFWRGRVDE